MVLLLVIIVPPLGAESLFDARGASLFKDHTARMVGDIVTVIVSEATDAENKGSSEFDKNTKVSGGIRVDGFLDYMFPGWFEPMEPIKNMDIDPTEKSGGSGKTSQGNTFTTRITATVIEVLPNGNLVIEGTKAIKVNEEKQDLVLKGVVRPEDISPMNTVLSTQIADVEMFYKGKGPVSQRNKPGIISKIFNWIF